MNLVGPSFPNSVSERTSRETPFRERSACPRRRYTAIAKQRFPDWVPKQSLEPEKRKPLIDSDCFCSYF
jgi:hypothetical protein